MKEFKKYQLVTDDTCSLYPTQDSLEHTFLHCNESINFFTKALRWFNDYYKAKIQLSHEQINICHLKRSCRNCQNLINADYDYQFYYKRNILHPQNVVEEASFR